MHKVNILYSHHKYTKNAGCNDLKGVRSLDTLAVLTIVDTSFAVVHATDELIHSYSVLYYKNLPY